MSREQLVADYKQKLAVDAEAQTGWAASDTAWGALCAWDNANRLELPAYRAGAGLRSRKAKVTA